MNADDLRRLIGPLLAVAAIILFIITGNYAAAAIVAALWVLVIGPAVLVSRRLLAS